MPVAATNPPPRRMPEARTASAAVFQEEWQVYRKVVDNNYLFHREAYAVLRGLLLAEAPARFRFLDIACGDASATIGALSGTHVGHYHGLDLSEPALALAAATLRALPCPFELTRQDFVTALCERTVSADVAWIGLSLHHLERPRKRELMSHAREILGEGGKLVVYENASPGDESRDEWLRRWDAQRADWTAFSDAEWRAITDHVHANDHPETHRTWEALGHEAGFARVRCLYESPTELFRLYAFDS